MRCIFSPEENNACYLFLILICTPPSPPCQAVIHFIPTATKMNFKKKDNRHPKDHATAVTGSRSFSGTFSSCSLLCACELSHSKKASPHDTHDQICLTLNMSHSERIQRTIPSWSNALFPKKQKKRCHAQGFCSMYISPNTKKPAP